MLVGVGLDAEQHDATVVFGRHAPRRVEGPIFGLGVDERLNELAEHVIDPREHRGRGPEVAGEKARRRLREALAGGQEGRDVGAPEAVDRLLGIADEEQPPGIDGHFGPGPVAVGRIARAEQGGQLDLDRIGVLELVDEDPAVPVAQTRARPRAMLRVAEQRAREHEQIVEVELTRGPPLCDRALGTSRNRGNQPLDCDVEYRVGHRLALFAQLGDAFAQAIDVCPVLLVTGVADPERRLIRPQELDTFGVVERGAQSVPIVGELVETREHGVGVGPAVDARCAHRVELLEPTVERQPGQRRRLADPIEQVPVVVEHLGHRAEMLQLHVGREEDEHRRLERRIVEELVDELVPARLERETRRDLVAHFDPGRQSDLDREFGEDALRKRVQGGDGGRVEVVERGLAAGPHDLRLGGRRRPPPELPANTVTELRRGLLGERDGGDRRHRDGKVGSVGGDQSDDPVDERGRLARARAGLDEQSGAELGPYCFARGCIAGIVEEGELVGHSSPSASECDKRLSTTSPGASRLLSHSRQRSVVPIPSGSQK